MSDETAGDTYRRLGIDGDKWAREFVLQFPETDLDTVRAWFCSSIMAGFDEATSRLQARIQQLESALEFYAEEKNWTANFDGLPDYEPIGNPSHVIKDKGARAREVLGRKG